MPESIKPPPVEEFRRMLDESLRAHDSWLALAGLFWLKQGSNRIGSDPGSDIVLNGEYAPQDLGVVDMRASGFHLRIFEPHAVKVGGVDRSQVELVPDTSENPTTVHLGPLTWMLIERNGRYAIRLWDNSRAALLSFPGRIWYPVDPAFRVTARFEPSEPGSSLEILNTIGDLNQIPSAGRLTFPIKRETLSLQAIGDPERGLSILFKDGTNAESTYGSGRYLTTEAVVDGQVELDFNRAYNPPCAFTAFATCPLPPSENHLPVRIEAGEKQPPPTQVPHH